MMTNGRLPCSLPAPHRAPRWSLCVLALLAPLLDLIGLTSVGLASSGLLVLAPPALAAPTVSGSSCGGTTDAGAHPALSGVSSERISLDRAEADLKGEYRLARGCPKRA